MKNFLMTLFFLLSFQVYAFNCNSMQTLHKSIKFQTKGQSFVHGELLLGQSLQNVFVGKLVMDDPSGIEYKLFDHNGQVFFFELLKDTGLPIDCPTGVCANPMPGSVVSKLSIEDVQGRRSQELFMCSIF